MASLIFLSECCHSEMIEEFLRSSAKGPWNCGIDRDRVATRNCENVTERSFQKFDSEGSERMSSFGRLRRWRMFTATSSICSGGGSKEMRCREFWILLRISWYLCWVKILASAMYFATSHTLQLVHSLWLLGTSLLKKSTHFMSGSEFFT